ncbi:MAG: alpha/beta fold hydrolase [Dactylosporangium sp.]|nr:alpha/beta hydrolase [Dactylosporangium sp.]NNJ62983.1 alpha/beta fold hydrolase [Dactylosporangium sp.]
MKRSAWRDAMIRCVVVTGAIVATTAVAVTAVPAAGSASPGSAAAADQPQRTIAWAPCQEDPTAECGTLALPIDWAEPDGPTFDLAVARRAATNQSTRIGALLLNPGGPGLSGIDNYIFTGGDRLSAEIRSRFDLVGFDPRGTQRSNPIICPGRTWVSGPYLYPASQADFETVVGHNQQLAADCRERTGPLFDHVDTLSTVHDLDALRAALGESTLTFYGASYGTLIGQQYAEVYGDRVRAMVLDGTMDHSLGTRDFLVTESASLHEALTGFAAWCDRTDACPLRTRGTQAVFAELKASAERGELISRTGTLIKPYDLVVRVLRASAGPAEDWVSVAAWLHDLTVAQPTDPVAQPTDPVAMPPTALAADGDDDIAPAGVAAPFCQDWDLPIDDYDQYSDLLRQMAEASPEMGPSRLALGRAIACLGWPGTVNNPQHPLRVTSGPTLLLVNSRYDPATGYNWATNAASQLADRAVLLTYEGPGHVLYPKSACIADSIDAYLIDRTVPASGSRCQLELPATAG